jgi:hypothetical protein
MVIDQFGNYCICKDCGFVGRGQEFGSTGDEDDEMREPFCHKCTSLNVSPATKEQVLAANRGQPDLGAALLRIEEEREIRAWIGGEIKRHEAVIARSEECPHCGSEMQVGSMSWKEMMMGCYHNEECPYRKENGISFRMDVGHDHAAIASFRRDLCTLETLNLLRRIRDNEGRAWDRLICVEDLDLWDYLKSEYEKIRRMYNLLGAKQ